MNQYDVARSSSVIPINQIINHNKLMKDIFPAVKSEFPAVKLGFAVVESNLKASIEINRQEKATENENHVHRRKAMTTKPTEEYSYRVVQR
ncbi:unnamed protein product [Amaranthus hypochondriacus]